MNTKPLRFRFVSASLSGLLLFFLISRLLGLTASLAKIRALLKLVSKTPKLFLKMFPHYRTQRRETNINNRTATCNTLFAICSLPPAWQIFVGKSTEIFAPLYHYPTTQGRIKARAVE